MDKYKMRKLVDKLKEAVEAYYLGSPVMSDKEYDDLFEELQAAEAQTGIVFPDSPTQRVGMDVAVSKRRKISHEIPSLSLDKTKDREVLRKWMDGRECILSWKMDGLTLILTYEGGRIISAATRGNGSVGEDVMDAVRYIEGIPSTIPFSGKLIVRGEGVMSYEEFARMNEEIAAEELKYKNCRNLAAGTIRALEPHIHASRQVVFHAFRLAYQEGDMPREYTRQMNFLAEQGFHCVKYTKCTSETLSAQIERCQERIRENRFPTDGLVLTFEDTAYGISLGRTGRFFRHSMAFKWADECALTAIKHVEWSPSKTGLLNPVAVFEPVELEGTKVSRASIHNVSIFRELMLGEGDQISVYKANMIIPQIAKNHTRSGSLSIPETCPVCGGRTQIQKSIASSREVETLHCINPDCQCKLLGKLEFFASRNAMNIEGVSQKTIKLLYENGLLQSFSGFYSLSIHEEKMKRLEGFGEIAVANILKAVEKSRKTDLAHFITALSIPLVGEDTASLIAKHCCFSADKFTDLLYHPEGLEEVNGIGDATVCAIRAWWNGFDREEYDSLLTHLDFQMPETKGKALLGLTFVITGSLKRFANREELKDFIISHGGRTAGGVSKNTSYLINNDTESSSGKNQKAKELGVPVLSEDAFLEMIP